MDMISDDEFLWGSGGAGNAHDELEYAVLELVKEFDEILVRDMNNEMSKDERVETYRNWAQELVELVR